MISCSCSRMIECWIFPSRQRRWGCKQNVFQYQGCRLCSPLKLTRDIWTVNIYMLIYLYFCLSITWTEVPHTARLIRPGCEPMTFGSWQYSSCHWDLHSDHSAISDVFASPCILYALYFPDINECDDSLCEAGSTCVDGIAQYTCVCADGYTGTYCDLGNVE